MRSDKSVRPFPYTELEFAVLGLERISSFVWAIVAAYEIFESFTSANPVKLWQFVFAILSIAAWLYGYKKIIDEGSRTAFLPLAAILLSTPLISNLWARESWTAYGLLTIAFVVYASDLANFWQIALSGVIALALQITIAEYAFKTVSDRSDMAFGKTYFSSTWLIVILVSTYITRKRFSDVAKQIDDETEKRTLHQQNQMKKIRLLNLHDYLNLKLHGTVLNTLLVMKNRLVKNQDISDLISIFVNEMKEFEDSNTIDSRVLKDRMIQGVNFSANRRTNVTFLLENLPNSLEIGEEQIIEIVREVVNNIKRHTLATEISVEINVTENDILYMSISDNSPLVVGDTNIEPLLESAKKSQTLRRLVAAVDGRWTVHHEQTSKKLVTEIVVNLVESNDDRDFILEEVRGNSFDFISKNLIFTSGFYGVLILPLLISVHGLQTPILFFSAAIALFWASNRPSKFSNFLAIIATISGTIVIPAFFWAHTDCLDLRSLPWIFNGLLGPVFGISVLKFRKYSTITKWLPISIIIVESLLTIWFLPRQCNQILQGSTPGLIAIGIAALLLGRARKTSRKRILERRMAQVNSSQDIEMINESLAQERKNIVSELKGFQAALVQENTRNEYSVKDLQIQIDKIRVFLLCSEYFESGLVRALYSLAKSRILAGNQTKIAIIAEGDQLRDLDPELATCLAIIFEYCRTGPMELLLTSGGNQIDVDIAIEQYKDIPFNSLIRMQEQGIRITAN